MKLGKYEYYKCGHQYHVIGLALDTIHHKEGDIRSEDGKIQHQKTVIYKALYPCPDLEEEFGLYPYFTRTLDSFLSEVDDDGVSKPMFRYIGPMD